MTKRLKLMPDYDCYPLWYSDSDFGNVEPTTLTLSQATRDRLESWAKKYDDTLNEEYPPNSGFVTPEEEAEFELEGVLLWLQLRRELAPDYEVVYYSYGLGQLLTHPNEMKLWSSLTSLLSTKKSNLQPSKSATLVPEHDST